jgi:hypothetical protein
VWEWEEIQEVLWSESMTRAPDRILRLRIQLLEAWRDPEHEEHESWRTWVGPRFDPERFDPAKVRFEKPARRLREVYDLA